MLRCPHPHASWCQIPTYVFFSMRRFMFFIEMSAYKCPIILIGSCWCNIAKLTMKDLQSYR